MDTKQMTDKLGQPVQVGDEVVIALAARTLTIGTVSKLTPKGARVRHMAHTTTWEGEKRSYVTTAQRNREMFVKVQQAV